VFVDNFLNIKHRLVLLLNVSLLELH